MANTLVSHIPKFLIDLERTVQAEVLRVTEKIKQDTQNDCPVITGQLKASVYIRPIQNGQQLGYSADYAASVDYRTGFFRDNVVLNERYYVEGMVQALNNLIRRY